MLKIIDGKRYNTETATEVCYHGNAYGRSDFKCVNMTLYRTMKGGWFVAGWGGALTRYAYNTGNGSGGQASIWVVSDDEARDIIEGDEAYAMLEKYFSVEDA